jgi:hypothetical protein
LIQQAHDTGIDNAVVDIRAIADVAQDSLIDEPVKLVWHSLGLHSDRLRQRRNRQARALHQSVQQAQARSVTEDFERPLKPNCLRQWDQRTGRKPWLGRALGREDGSSDHVIDLDQRSVYWTVTLLHDIV